MVQHNLDFSVFKGMTLSTVTIQVVGSEGALQNFISVFAATPGVTLIGSPQVTANRNMREGKKRLTVLASVVSYRE
jgi:hypothetical protein